MGKTAMTQLIMLLDEQILQHDDVIGKALSVVKDRATKLLETEKIQLLEMHLSGQEYSDSPCQYGNRDEAHEEYKRKFS